MEGTIIRRARKSGKPAWRLQIGAGKTAEDKRQRISRTFDRKGDAEDEQRRLIEKIKGGDFVHRQEPRTFGEYAEHWLKTHADAKLAPKTAERYRSLIGHVTREIGSVPLIKVAALQLEAVYGELYNKMSTKSVNHVHAAVRSALNSAVRLKLIPCNPACACVVMKPEPTEAKALEMAEVERYLKIANDTWVDGILMTTSGTGVRRGEILAARWSDLNFESGVLVVGRALTQTKKKGLKLKSTKNRSIRRIILSTSTLEWLRMHRERQEQNRRLFGKDYRADLDLIFAAPDGNFLLPSSVSRACVRMARKAGLEQTGLHTLRHSHATLLLSNGVPLAVVSKRLGHSNPYTTAKIYSHALPSDEQAVADMWESIRAGKPAANKRAPSPAGLAAPNGTAAESEIKVN